MHGRVYFHFCPLLPAPKTNMPVEGAAPAAPGAGVAAGGAPNVNGGGAAAAAAVGCAAAVLPNVNGEAEVAPNGPLPKPPMPPKALPPNPPADDVDPSPKGVAAAAGAGVGAGAGVVVCAEPANANGELAGGGAVAAPALKLNVDAGVTTAGAGVAAGVVAAGAAGHGAVWKGPADGAAVCALAANENSGAAAGAGAADVVDGGVGAVAAKLTVAKGFGAAPFVLAPPNAPPAAPPGRFAFTNLRPAGMLGGRPASNAEPPMGPPAAVKANGGGALVSPSSPCSSSPSSSLSPPPLPLDTTPISSAPRSVRFRVPPVKRTSASSSARRCFSSSAARALRSSTTRAASWICFRACWSRTRKEARVCERVRGGRNFGAQGLASKKCAGEWRPEARRRVSTRPCNAPSQLRGRASKTGSPQAARPLLELQTQTHAFRLEALPHACRHPSPPHPRQQLQAQIH